MSLKDEDGFAVFPPDGRGLFGVFLFIPKDSRVPGAKFPKFCVCEIRRDPRAPDGWNPTRKDFSPAQRVKGKYYPRLFISLDALDGVINALCRLRERIKGASPPPEAVKAVEAAEKAEEEADFEAMFEKVFGRAPR